MKAFVEDKETDLFKQVRDGACYIERGSFVWDTTSKDVIEIRTSFYFCSQFWTSFIVTKINPEEECESLVRALITGCPHYSVEY